MKDGFRTVAIACAASGALLIAPPAFAQAWIGQVVGQMAAQQAEAAREQACLAGAPPNPKQVPKIMAKLQTQIAAYFALDSQSKAAALGKVFSLTTEGVSFRDSDGTVSPAAIGARLDVLTPNLTMTSSVVAGDLKTARVIWAAAAPDGSAPKIYAVDFIGTVDAFWGSSDWRIWHMAVLPQEQAPSPPGAYCHFDPAQGF